MKKELSENDGVQGLRKVEKAASAQIKMFEDFQKTRRTIAQDYLKK